MILSIGDWVLGTGYWVFGIGQLKDKYLVPNC
jgi:hypothetical protein